MRATEWVSIIAHPFFASVREPPPWAHRTLTLNLISGRLAGDQWVMDISKNQR